MTRLVWDDTGNKLFEFGVDRGVLYPSSSTTGVAWNGLIGVNERPDGGDPTAYYLDGIKYYDSSSTENFTANVTAFTYPEEFGPCIGIEYDDYGLGYDQQEKIPFGMTYRTRLGNDVSGVDLGYKIHLVYNAVASSSDRDYNTITEDPDALVFSWDIATTPETISGRKPTSHLIINSTKAKPDTLQVFEDIIYGTSTTAPRLPSVYEVTTHFSDWAAFQIVPTTGTGINPLIPEGPYNDLEGDLNVGLLEKATGSRLTSTSINGLYRMV